jgi:hypothetical protein
LSYIGWLIVGFLLLGNFSAWGFLVNFVTYICMMLDDYNA